MGNINTHQLRVFLEAAEALNFTQAAQRLRVSQPSVSQHIQALEVHFGTPLFRRSGRSIELTAAGCALIPQARELIFLAEHITNAMVLWQAEAYGRLRLACSCPSGRYLLPPLLAHLRQNQAEVQTDCVHTCGQEALQMLQAGRVHLALLLDPPPLAELVSRPIFTETLRLIVPAHHPWAQRASVTPPELFQADFILPSEGAELHATLRQALAEIGLSLYELKPVVTLDSPEGLAAAVQAGLGIGFVPQVILDRLPPGSVHALEVAGLRLQCPVYLVRSLQHPLAGAQSAFWNLLCDLTPLPQTAATVAGGNSPNPCKS